MRLQVAIPEAHVGPAVLDGALEAVTRLNQSLLTSGQVPTFREALASGVRWAPEPPGQEHFDHAQLVTQRKWGDCDDLAPYRAADLRVSGEDPQAFARVVRTGPKRWHAIVQRGNGEMEDPSREAGMGTAKHGVSGYEVVVGVDAAAVSPMFSPRGRPTIALYPNRRTGVWYARADLPWLGSRYAMSATSKSRRPGAALSDAVLGACIVGQASGVAEPDDVARLFVANAVAQGMPEREVLQQLADRGMPMSAREWRHAANVGHFFRTGRAQAGVQYTRF